MGEAAYGFERVLNKSGDILLYNSVEEWEINGYVNFGSD